MAHAADKLLTRDEARRIAANIAMPTLLAKPPNESDLRVDLINGSMIRL